MTRHLLVTNDFPPKIGGIQSYLWELWRRLPPDDVTVLTSPHADADLFDREPALPHRPHPGAGAPAPPAAWSAGSGAWPPTSAPRRWCSTPPSRSD